MSAKKAWFIKKRGSYLPNSWQGWLTYIPYLAYIIGVLVYVDVSKDNFWLAFFTVMPNWIIASIIMTWVAKNKS